MKLLQQLIQTYESYNNNTDLSSFNKSIERIETLLEQLAPYFVQGSHFRERVEALNGDVQYVNALEANLKAMERNVQELHQYTNTTVDS